MKRNEVRRSGVICCYSIESCRSERFTISKIHARVPKSQPRPKDDSGGESRNQEPETGETREGFDTFDLLANSSPDPSHNNDQEDIASHSKSLNGLAHDGGCWRCCRTVFPVNLRHVLIGPCLQQHGASPAVAQATGWDDLNLTQV